MVDSGVMTEPWEPTDIEKETYMSHLSHAPSYVGAALAGGLGYMFGRDSNSHDEDAQAVHDLAEGLRAKHGDEKAKEMMSKLNEPGAEVSAADARDEEPQKVVTDEHSAGALSAVEAQQISSIEPPSPVDEAESARVITSEPMPVPIELGLSALSFQDTEPVEVSVPEPIAPTLSSASIMSQTTAPVESRVESVRSIERDVSPWSFSKKRAQQIEPEAPTFPAFIDSVTDRVVEKELPLDYAPLSSQQTEPITPERPRTAIAVTKPIQTATPPIPERSNRGKAFVAGADNTKPGQGFFESILGKVRPAADSATIIAEDESSPPQPAKRAFTDTSVDVENRSPTLLAKELPKEIRTPFMAIDTNTAQRPQSPKKDVLAPSKPSIHIPVSTPVRVPRKPMFDEGTQTMISSERLEALFRAEEQLKQTPTSPTKAAPGSPRKNREWVETGTFKAPRRPSSSGSMRSRAAAPPPLPADHKQVIAAAAEKAPLVPPPPRSTTPTTQPTPMMPTTPRPQPMTPGQMGPPLMPASAYRTRSHSRTPSNARQPLTADRGGFTVRANHTPSVASRTSRGDAASSVTRRSSVSSFASELDARFNIARNAYGPDSFDPNTTDPRMIQAITQTMIGEFLWKYTRKTGRSEMSETRHRRFFWVHPYTRTLYWSEQDPATAGRAQLKAKSVAMQAVRVVTDDNAFPPGLHRKSLVVVTPGRSIKFTAPTGQRHETWFNALSYLLLRTANEREREDEGHVTAEDIEEFNPGGGSSYGRNFSRLSRR
ncbi:hypothetical protein LTS18_007630, partial [Coniosporium uncinatum]